MILEDYENSQIVMKFYLGGILLFSIPFEFVIYNKHFIDIDISYEDLNPPYFEEGEGILFRSFPIQNKIPTFSITNKYLCYVPSQYKRYFINLQGSFENYLKKFSSKTLSTLRRKVKNYDKFRLREDNWREYCTSEEMQIFYVQAREVSAKTYQERLIGAGLPASDIFRKSMEELARSNLVRGYILFYQSKPISYLYCPIINNDIVIYRYLGYDPDYKKWSPGTVLQYKILEKLFNDNRWRMFDFTEGDGDHKELFSNDYTQCADIYYFKRTTRNLLLIYFHLAFTKVSRGITLLSEKLGIKSSLKKAIRKNYGKSK